ncbi:hypothetical protein T492DRAFT_448073 [Pavlovales sp. CCMP2436]|nr:hypothetical protein T492DRAFT_448073 [Pavlovales sp. CCMP2436]
MALSCLPMQQLEIMRPVSVPCPAAHCEPSRPLPPPRPHTAKCLQHSAQRAPRWPSSRSFPFFILALRSFRAVRSPPGPQRVPPAGSAWPRQKLRRLRQTRMR